VKKMPKAKATGTGQAPEPIFGPAKHGTGKRMLDSISSSQSAGGPPIPSFHRGNTNLAIFGGDPAKAKKDGKG